MYLTKVTNKKINNKSMVNKEFLMVNKKFLSIKLIGKYLHPLVPDPALFLNDSVALESGP
jgi:hypothetical protein